MAILAGLLGLGLLAADPPATAAPPPAPADFKLVVRLFGVKPEPLSSAELVVRRGRGYWFIKERPEEILVVEPTEALVTLIDLDRRVQCELTAGRLDRAIERRYKTLDALSTKKRASESRGDRLLGTMTRDLIDPRFQVERDPKTRRLRLRNGSVEMVVDREPEADTARARMVVNCLAADVKVGALREPGDVPPFTRLEVFRILAEEPTSRPTRLDVVLRLTGPPQKMALTYQLVPDLTDREREAIGRVDALRTRMPFVPYEKYETPGGD